LFGQPEGKRPLGRYQCMWEDYSEMDLREIEWSGMDWSDMGQKRD
jgi:hypothetical protein